MPRITEAHEGHCGLGALFEVRSNSAGTYWAAIAATRRARTYVREGGSSLSELFDSIAAALSSDRDRPVVSIGRHDDLTLRDLVAVGAWVRGEHAELATVGEGAVLHWRRGPFTRQLPRDEATPGGVRLCSAMLEPGDQLVLLSSALASAWDRLPERTFSCWPHQLLPRLGAYAASGTMLVVEPLIDSRTVRDPYFEFRYQKEAQERGVRSYVVFLDKASGLAFHPSDPARPLAFGGDYDGPYPMSAVDARQAWLAECELRPELLPASSWFLPFLDKVCAGDDFSLDDLEPFSERVRILPSRISGE